MILKEYCMQEIDYLGTKITVPNSGYIYTDHMGQIFWTDFKPYICTRHNRWDIDWDASEIQIGTFDINDDFEWRETLVCL